MIVEVIFQKQYGKEVDGEVRFFGEENIDGAERAYAHSMEEAIRWVQGHPQWSEENAHMDDLHDGRVIITPKEGWMDIRNDPYYMFAEDFRPDHTHERVRVWIVGRNTLYESSHLRPYSGE